MGPHTPFEPPLAPDLQLLMLGRPTAQDFRLYKFSREPTAVMPLAFARFPLAIHSSGILGRDGQLYVTVTGQSTVIGGAMAPPKLTGASGETARAVVAAACTTTISWRTLPASAYNFGTRALARRPLPLRCGGPSAALSVQRAGRASRPTLPPNRVCTG